MPSPGVLLLRESAAVVLRPRAYLRRAVVLVLLLLLIGVAWSVGAPRGGGWTSQALGSVARTLLSTFYVGLTLLLLFSMPGAAGGLIAGEREAGSLGLLRMTPLGPYQIVAEKFLSRIAHAAQLIVLAGPLFFAPLFFGGVTVMEVLTVILFPLSAATWAAGLGLVFSSFHRRAASAVLWTYLAAVAWHVLGSGLLEALGATPASPLVFHLFPLWTYLVLPVQQNLAPDPALLWLVPLETAAFAAACVVLAGWLMGREGRAGAVAMDRETPVQVRRRVWANPVAWKEVRAGGTLAVRRLMAAALALTGFSIFWALPKRWPLLQWGAGSDVLYAALGVAIAAGGLIGAAWARRRRFYWTLALVAAVAGTGIWCAAVLVTPRTSPGIGTMTLQVVLFPLVYFVHFFMLLGAAVAGATAVVQERVRGTLETLRMTPLPSRAFIQGKVWGCWWTLLPAGVVLVLGCGMAVMTREPSPLGVILALAVAFASLFAVVRMGLFVSARSRRPAQAILLSMGLLIGYLALLPLLGILLFQIDGEPVLYLNPWYWMAEGMSPAASRRGVGSAAAGALLFCAGAIGLGLALQALAAKAFASEWRDGRR